MKAPVPRSCDLAVSFEVLFYCTGFALSAVFHAFSISSPLLFCCFLLLQQATALPRCCSDITNLAVLGFFSLPSLPLGFSESLLGLSEGSIE